MKDKNIYKTVSLLLVIGLIMSSLVSLVGNATVVNESQEVLRRQKHYEEERKIGVKDAQPVGPRSAAYPPKNYTIPETYLSYPLEETPENVSVPSNITIYGYLKNETGDPIRNETILILNSVPGPDILLEVAKTDHNGYLNVTRHGPFTGFYNIYACIYNTTNPLHLRTNTVTNITEGDIVELEMSNNFTYSKGQRSPADYTVWGYCGYIDQPVRQARVEIWEDTILGDYCQGSVWTNNYGWYSARIEKIIGGDRTFYAKLMAENSACWVEYISGSYGMVYSKNSPSKTCSDHSTIQLDDIIGNHACWYILEQTQKGYEWLKSKTGWNRGQKVLVLYPKGSGPVCYGDYIHIPSGWEDAWTILHEYGHSLQWEVYGDRWPDSDYIGAEHTMGSEFDGGFAICEGWADFYAYLVTQDSTWIEQTRSSATDDHIEEWHDEFLFDGDIIEGSIADILWDIWDDTPNEEICALDRNGDNMLTGSDAPLEHLSYDQISDSNLNKIWTIMRYDDPDSIHEFWDAWFNRGYGQKYELKVIYYDHGVIKNENQPTVGSMSPAGGFCSGAIDITATGISDPDTEDQNYIHVKFGYYYDVNSNGLADDGNTWNLIAESTSSASTRTVSWNTNSFNGHYLVRATVDDGMKEVSRIVSLSVDNTPPSGSVSINSGATYTTSTSVTLTLTYSDGTVNSISGENYGDYSISDYTHTYSPITISGTYSGKAVISVRVWIDITHTYIGDLDIWVVHPDGTEYQIWNNQGGSADDIHQWFYITDAFDGKCVPGTWKLHVYDGYAQDTGYIDYWNIDITYCSASGVDKVRYSNDGTWDTEVWESPTTTKTWTLTSSDGTKTVWYQIKDAAGNTFTPSDTIILDATPPTITDNQPGDDTWRNSAGTTYNVDFSDLTSLLNYAQYKITTATDKNEYSYCWTGDMWDKNDDYNHQEFLWNEDNNGFVYSLKNSGTISMKSAFNSGYNAAQDEEWYVDGCDHSTPQFYEWMTNMASYTYL